jgi:hypothetical protein
MAMSFDPQQETWGGSKGGGSYGLDNYGDSGGKNVAPLYLANKPPGLMSEDVVINQPFHGYFMGYFDGILWGMMRYFYEIWYWI